MLSLGDEVLLRRLVCFSALLSLVGACMIIFSSLRSRELLMRFFAIRLIFVLACTNAATAVIHIFGAFLPANSFASSTWICAVQALGLLYFNLASIMWTSCFAFTLYRDLVPSYRRQALRTYETIYHSICWPVSAPTRRHASS